MVSPYLLQPLRPLWEVNLALASALAENTLRLLEQAAATEAENSRKLRLIAQRLGVTV